MFETNNLILNFIHLKQYLYIYRKSRNYPPPTIEKQGFFLGVGKIRKFLIIEKFNIIFNLNC